MNVLDNIQSQYQKLSKTQKNIADYIIRVPYKVCFFSLKQLSNEASVTETTIINFTKKIGYKNFIEFKSELQTYVKMMVSPPDKILNALKNGKFIDQSLSDVIYTELQEVKKTIANIKMADVVMAVKILKNANKIYLLGVGISEVVVKFLLLRLRLLGLDVEVFEVSTYNVLSLQLLKIKEEDVFIIVSFPQYSKLAALTVEYLNQKTAV